MWPTCYLQYDGCTRHSNEDEHVIPLHLGGTDDLSNHRGACTSCHKKKTQSEAQQARPSRRRQPEPHPGIR